MSKIFEYPMKIHHLRRARLSKQMTEQYKQMLLDGIKSGEAARILADENLYRIETIYNLVDIKKVKHEIRTEKLRAYSLKINKRAKSCK